MEYFKLVTTYERIIKVKSVRDLLDGYIKNDLPFDNDKLTNFNIILIDKPKQKIPSYINGDIKECE